MTSRIRTTEELRDALKQKLNELKDAFKADAVTLHLYDPQRERLYFPVSINLFQEQRFLQGAPSMERGTGKIVRTRLPIIADDAEHHPDLTGPFTHVEKVKAAAGFPLLDPDSGEVMGVLFVDHRRPHQFEKDEIERIQSQISELAEFIGWCLQGDQGQMLRGALQMETDLRLEEARLQDIINRLWNVLGDVDIALWTRERGKRDLRIQMHRGLDRNFADRVSVNLDTDSSNIIAVAFVGGEEVLIESPQTDPRAIFNIDTSVAWERVLAVPVFSEYHRLGVLTIFRRERLGFTRRERDTVSAFANLIAVTVESENRIIALNALHDVGVRLTLVTDLSDILHEVVRSACQVIGADVATIHLYDPARQAFRDLEHSAVFPAQARPDVEKPLAKGGLSARIVEQGRIYCEDVDAQPDRTALSTFVEKQGIKAYVGTRLISIDEPLGVLYVSFREKRRFSPEDLALIQILANYASTAIYRTELLNQRAAVTEIGSEIASKLDRDELLQTILERSVHLLKCRDGSIALFDKSTGELVFQHAVGEQQWERLGPGEGLTGAAVQSRRPVRVGDVTKDPRYVEHVLETRSELDVPLLVGDELIGVLNVESPRYNAFSEEDERLAMTLASQAAVALYNAELFQRTQEQLEQRKALHEIARDITSVLKVDELLNKILERSLELLRCPVGSITLLNRATGELEFHYAIGKQVGMRLPVDKGLMTMAAQTRKPVRVGDVTEKPWRTRYVEHVAETRSELDVPLLVGDELIGVLNAESPRYNAFSEDDERLAMTLASQAAVALYNAMLFEQRNALVEFGQAVTSEIRLREDEVLDLIYEQASQLMDTDNMYIALYDEAIDTVRFGLAFVNGRRVDVETEEGWQPRRAGKGRTEEIIRTKKPLFHATKAEAEEWYSQPEHQEYIGEPFASWLGVPMMVGERVLGVIAVYHPKRDHVYSGDDLSIL
ncbi:MAG: GAF domain-containing protein, partial [Chloroflexi bacterium]|nr:GAF domain-containing protein [Chloroflexota bacterium]